MLIGDMGEYLLPEQPEELLEPHPLKKVEEGGVSGCLGKLQIHGCSERMVMTLGESLQIPVALRQPLRMSRISIKSSNHWG